MLFTGEARGGVFMNRIRGKRVKQCGKGQCFWRKLWIIGVFAVLIVSLHVSVAEARSQRPEQKERYIKMADGSGRYLKKEGKGWYLRDRDGTVSGGVHRVVPERKGRSVFEKGYYFFEEDGRLCTRRDFHVLAQTAGKKKFQGMYYFGGKNGKLYTKKGWIAVGRKRYYLTSAGKCVTDRWKSGYYLQSNGVMAKNKQTPDGTWVGYDGKKCPENEVALGKLKKKLVDTVRRYRGSWSVYVKNLETGDVVNINDRSMYSASTIKAFVMASVYNEIAHGRMEESSTVRSLLHSMITVSSNDAYNTLVCAQGNSFVSGAAVVNRYLKKQGYDQTGCHHTLHPASCASTGDGGRNMTSAKDCGVLLERIYRGKCVSRKYSQKMQSLLLQQKRRGKIPAGLPAGVKAANKTGETSTTQHDMAIVYGEKTDYVICVFSTGGGASAVSGIRNISKIVYDYLNE